MVAHFQLLLISLLRFEVGQLYLKLFLLDFDTNIIRNSFDHCGITSQSNLHSALRAVVEQNRTITDADGNKIRPEKENQKTGQKQKKSK